MRDMKNAAEQKPEADPPKPVPGSKGRPSPADAKDKKPVSDGDAIAEVGDAVGGPA